MMQKVVGSVVCLMVVVVLLGEVKVGKAVTCSPLELSPCLGAITSGQPPSGACCTKMRQQRPCLCGYLKDPNLRQYINSPNARKIKGNTGHWQRKTNLSLKDKNVVTSNAFEVLEDNVPGHFEQCINLALEKKNRSRHGASSSRPRQCLDLCLATRTLPRPYEAIVYIS